MKKLIQEILKNIQFFTTLDVLSEIDNLSKDYYFIESVFPTEYWGGNDFELDPSKALIFTKDEYNCEITRLSSFIEVRALPLDVLLARIRASNVFEYTHKGSTQVVPRSFFTPLNGFSETEISEILEVNPGGIWRSKYDLDRAVIRRVSG